MKEKSRYRRGRLMKTRKILFGTAYYPEYMSCDRMDEDIRMMKAAGMNTVRIAESTWSTLEPRENVFDFTYIDEVLEKTQEAGINVIVGTPTYAVPPWLVRKDPEIMVETKKGRARYGHRQLFDLLNPTFRCRAENVIRHLVSYTAGYAHVIGFQIDNETKHYGNTGKYMQEAFRRYLREKFVTTERLNEAFGLAYWSNSIADWDDFPDIRGCVNGGLMAEFEKFRRTVAADYLAWQARIVSEYKRDDQFITHNLDFQWKKFGADIAQDGYSYGVQPDLNHYEAAKCLTIAGTDIYHPTQDELTGAETAFCGDIIRSLKDDNYLVLECQAQAFKYWTPYPGQLRLHAYSHLASGAQGIMYWNWHSIHSGYETYWKGLLSHDLGTNPTYEEACRIGQEWKKLGTALCKMKKNNRVVLVVDNHSLSALEWFPIDKDLTYNDVVRWMYDSLYEMNIECDVVDINALEPDRYDMIVTPALYCITEEMLKKLDTFVKSGGVLVSSFKSFVADEYVRVYPDTQPHLLQECFGMSCNQYTEPGRTKLAGRQVRYIAELLNPDKNAGTERLAMYEHKYWGAYAGITRHEYGRGCAYYIGCYTDKDVLKEVYKKAAADAKISVPLFSWPVIMRSGVISSKTEGADRTLHYILHYSEEEREAPCPFTAARDILNGREYRSGDNIRLRDWDVLILEEL